jgi:alpha-L-fucosidase
MKYTLKSILFLAITMLAAAFPAAAAAPDQPADQSARFGWFNATKAGMFIHWGPYSVSGCEWKGQHGVRDAHLQNEFRIPMAEYATLVRAFNPVKFDADTWVKLAKDAGLGYVVYVAKHHDGFAMFDSPSNPYNMVVATPFARDPLKELAAACQAQGLVLCVYYSLGRDWSVPGVPRGGWRSNDWDFPNPPADAQKTYIETKVKPQLRELLTQYGPIGALWFDTPEKTSAAHSAEIRDLIKSLQPDCLINARIGNRLGDYDIHEQQIPAKSIHRPWETCLTIGRRWAYDIKDDQWKSPEMIIRCLVDVASKGGNFLINIGPTGEGVVPAPSVERLHSLGDWLRVNGESIRGSTAAKISADSGSGMVFHAINPDGSEKKPNAGGAPKPHEVSLPRGWRATVTPGCIYIHLFDRPENGLVSIKGISGPVKSVVMLADPERRPLEFKQDESGAFSVALPDGIWDPRATVLKLGMAAESL